MKQKKPDQLLRRKSFSLLVFLCCALPFVLSNVAYAVQETKEAVIDAETKKSETAEDFDIELQLKSFDKVWEIIDTTHWDAELVGEKWDEAKANYRPMVADAKNAGEVRQILEKMLGELGQSHFGIIPAESYESEDVKDGGISQAGLVCRSTPDGILVVRVMAGSPAADAGIQTGWAVKKIRGKDLAKISERLKKAAKGPVRYETLVGLRTNYMLSGKAGTKIQIELIDGENKQREFELEFDEPTGLMAEFGSLPPIQVRSETRTLDNNIGYFTFSAFFAPPQIMPKFRQAVRNPKHSNGIIIDLRGNIGGIGGMTMGMSNEFATADAYLGVMRSKSGELKFAVQEHYDPVSCPVAVLVDECSISSAEIMAGGLQDLKLAKIIGSRTAGLALPSNVTELPNGDGFQYAMADYKSASGKSLEKDGVVPDTIVELNRDVLLRDEDPVLSKAVEWITSQIDK